MCNKRAVLSNDRIMEILFLLGAFCLLSLSCATNKPTSPPDIPIDVNYGNFHINKGIAYRDRPWYNVSSPVGFEQSFYHDADGVIISNMYGAYYYHPWNVLHWGLLYLCSYELSGDQEYVQLAQRYSNRLMIMGTRVNGAIYIPYEFNEVLHGGSSHDVLMAPWYSGLAQGMALCFYSRFYELTNDVSYKNIADSIFQSFLYMDSSVSIWTAMVDSAKYYWVEEYPFYPPDHVLNGFQTAMICLYDYYEISDNPKCLTIFDAGCATLIHYFDQFRNPGEISYYCLRHRIQPENYHYLHITQFELLFDISGDSIFSNLADTLRSDHP